jgi:ATP-dependent Lhr-like helicase
VTVGGRPALSVHAGGRTLRVVGRPDDVQPALEALAEAVRAGRLRKLSVDTIDGQPAVASPLAERLVALGFRRGLHDFALAPGDA